MVIGRDSNGRWACGEISPSASRICRQSSGSTRCFRFRSPPASAVFWSYLVVGVGQALVCLVFCEIVSQYPITGGILPWAGRLVGERWGWLAGWTYLWALCVTIAAVAVGAAPFIATLFGASAPNSSMTMTAIALGLLVLSTVLNLSGTKWLARMVLFGFLAELTGALVVGAYLLTFCRVQLLDVLFDTFDIRIDGSYWPAFLAAGLAGIFQYYGFEACGDVGGRGDPCGVPRQCG